LEIAYFNGTMPHRYSVALTITTLGGTIVGMIAFGLSADIWGRRKMYGLELIITIFSTLGVAGMEILSGDRDRRRASIFSFGLCS